MSNDKEIARIFKLWAKISMMVVDGVRDATEVASTLQRLLEKPTPVWHEEEGIIYFTVKSDGTTGESWIRRLERNGLSLKDRTKQLLQSSDFKSTSNEVIKVALLKGKGRIVSRIYGEAAKRKFSKPNAELACLIRLKFSDDEIEAMGVRCILTMHEPLKDLSGYSHLLVTHRGSNGSSFLGTSRYEAYCQWSDEYGLAFVAS